MTMTTASKNANARPSPKLQSVRERENRVSEAASPSPSLAEIKQGDSAILALVDDWRVLKPKVDEAEKALRLSEASWLPPEFPKALIATVADGHIFHREYVPAPGKPFGEKEVGQIRSILHFTDCIRVMRGREADIVEARGSEIVAAWRNWTEAGNIVSGHVIAARSRRADLAKQEAALFHRLALTTAQSSAGVMAKLSVASAYFEASGVVAKAAVEAECTTLDVLRSVAADFKRLRLGGEEPRDASRY
jgi:hypothetical protein